MKRCWKGALLSGLGFPGLGEFWLKSYLRGAAFMVAASASLSLVVIEAAQKAVAALETVEREGGAVDLVAIANMAVRSAGGADAGTAVVAPVVLVLVWALSAVDAYWVGRQIDLAEQGEGPSDAGRDVVDSKGGAGS